MSYLVLARKYRPQTFEEVVKQEHVTRTLVNAIETDRLAHAILFAGPRGTGKTTVARILAKAMNCEQGPTGSPCNICRSCREVTGGHSVDVLEIDGASNNGVEHVRDLRDNVQYMPVHSRFKIYIIDEVHMLSTAAFNALLKTLEEPPAHVAFMFATTEPHKIPITVLSRCQRHDFRRVDMESLVTHMATLCSREGVDIPADTLALIAAEAGGSVRDALSLLDQIISSSKGNIVTEQVLDLLGVVDRRLLHETAAALIKGDLVGLLEMVEGVYQRGTDMKKFYIDIIDYFRNLLVTKISRDAGRLVDLPADEIRRMENQVKDVPAAFLNQVFSLLFKEEVNVRLSAHPKLALEVACFKIAQVKPVLPIDTLIEKLDLLRKEVYDPGGESGASPGPATAANESATTWGREPSSSAADSAPPAAAKQETYDPDAGTAETWQNILHAVERKSPALAANLANSSLKRITEKGLDIEVNGNDFNLELLKKAKSKSTLKEICSHFFGREVEVLLKAGEKKQKKISETSLEAEQMKKKALKHPLVGQAIEIFKPKIVDVKIIEEDTK